MKITETNVTIMVRNMDRAISFYQSIGLVLKKRWEDHYAMLTTEGLTIGLHPASGDTVATSHVSIGFMIENADEAKELLDKLEVIYTFHDDKSGILVNFRDPDGTHLYFMQPRWK